MDAGETSVRLERLDEGAILRLVIDRPGARNALDRATMVKLDETVEGLAEDSALRCLIVTGAGDKAFVAGGDLKDLHSVEEAEAARVVGARMARVLDGLSGLSVPVIAAVNGAAHGGGAELCLACDLALMADTAVVGFRQLFFAVMGGWGGTTRLVRRVGRGQALRLLLERAELDAERALALGVVDEVVPAPALAAHSLALARTFAANAPGALRAAKEAVHLADRLPHDEAVEAELERFVSTWVSEDHTRAVAEWHESRARRKAAAEGDR